MLLNIQTNIVHSSGNGQIISTELDIKKEQHIHGIDDAK